ncbi:LuxR C-terminal-related transcriptional regulator [Granulicoccus sp. GXG6511]|uniref:LuxR C-terminal-related transcriptional regulator n=1 Tax=Granulicoccus sp. GXG6511 TaxID=3381351 RepID=UPI003D7EC55A
MSPTAPPITIALVNDYQVVIQGVARMLENHPRLRVLEIDSLADPDRPVDVVLYDAFAAQRREADLTRLLRDPRCGRVVVYSWHDGAAEVREVLGLGVHGYLSKALDAQEFADALVRAHAGEQVVEPKPVPDDFAAGDWPGRSQGLTAREAEIVALITQGVTNQDIARTCFLSINSVKSYIRSAYRKMGVQRRSQAVRWGIDHGLQPRPARVSGSEVSGL